MQVILFRMNRNISEIRNKNVRAQMYQKLKKEKDKESKKRKLENKNKPKQIPKTIENCRVVDETYVNDISNDPELQLDLRTDELSRHFRAKEPKTEEDQDESGESSVEEEAGNGKEATEEDSDFEEDEKEIDRLEKDYENESEEEDSDDEKSKDPKILITTHDMRIHLQTYKLCRELCRVLPNAHYFYRKNTRLTRIIPEAIKRGYSAMIVINEDRKIPNGMHISLLPEGPTMNFKLTNVKTSDEIKGASVKGFTKHKPEIILNNFNTRLGLQVGRSFAAMFPPDPQYEGRHCITFHNQRDYIFFRHHRYIFRSAKKVGIQELGPKFTLKLRSLQKGTFDTKFGEYEWVQKRHEMEQNRRKFSL